MDNETWTKRCSTQCRIDAIAVQLCDLYRVATDRGMAGAGWLRLLMEYLRERDGEQCQICHDPIDWLMKSGPRGDPSGLGPSIDHVVPRSVEVNDDPSNLRLAHWKCNRDRGRGRKGETTQLALIG